MHGVGILETAARWFEPGFSLLRVRSSSHYFFFQYSLWLELSALVPGSGWQRVAEGGVALVPVHWCMAAGGLALVLGALVRGSGRLSAGARCTGACQRET